MSPLIILAAAGALFYFGKKKKPAAPAAPFRDDCTATSDKALQAAIDRIAMPLLDAQKHVFSTIKEPTAQGLMFQTMWLEISGATLKKIDRQMGGKLAKNCPNGSPDLERFVGMIACSMMARLVRDGLVDEEPEDVTNACKDPAALGRTLLGLEGSAGLFGGEKKVLLVGPTGVLPR